MVHGQFPSEQGGDGVDYARHFRVIGLKSLKVSQGRYPKSLVIKTSGVPADHRLIHAASASFIESTEPIHNEVVGHIRVTQTLCEIRV